MLDGCSICFQNINYNLYSIIRLYLSIHAHGWFDHFPIPRFDQTVENSIILSFLDLVYKLTERDILPLLVNLIDWSSGSLDKSW